MIFLVELSGWSTCRKPHRQTIPLSSFLCTHSESPWRQLPCLLANTLFKGKFQRIVSIKTSFFPPRSVAQIQLCLTQTSGEVTNHLAVTAWFHNVQTEKVWGVCEHGLLSRWIFPLISWHGGNNPAPSVFTQPLREITVLPSAQGL